MIFYCFANDLLYECIIIKVGGLDCLFTTIWKSPLPLIQRLVGATDSDPSKETLAVGGSTAKA